MKHITKILYRHGDRTRVVVADVYTDDIETLRRECMEHYDADIVYFQYEESINK